MDNDKVYKSINEQERKKLPSNMGIIPRESDPNMISPQALEKRLKDNPEFNVKSLELETLNENSDAVMNLRFKTEIEYEDQTFKIDFGVYRTDHIDLQSYSLVNTIDNKSMEAASKQPYYIETKLWFNEDPMISFLFQLKVLSSLIPNAALVVDFSSLRLLSPHWLKMTVSSKTPPTPDYLYTIHAVYDEKEDGTKQYWMHTHGLHRCGSIELELMGIKSGPNQLYSLLNTTAHIFIKDYRKENEAFQVGYDGLGINLCWVRWEDALADFPKDILGGINDRTNEDESYNIHSEPSGILFAIEDGNYTSPEIYSKTLADNPIFYVRSDETLRMSALAKERFHMFKEIFDREHQSPQEKKMLLGKIFSKKEESEVSQWKFLVKMGLLTDNAESENDKEHLWFEVQNIEGDNITGILLNQPYWISKLNKNDIKTYSASEKLTDWIIYGPEASYKPDTIYLLFDF